MKNFKLLSSLLALVLLGFFIYSCSCSNCGKTGGANIPPDVLNNANALVISKTGETFFNDYIAPDFTLTRYVPPYYEMAYKLYIPEKPYVNTKITFTVDSTGQVVKSKDIIGIPDCAKTPSGCNWQIDKAAAISIAKENNFEEGVKEWKVQFVWNPERQIYVWYILNTIREFQGDFGYRGNGKEMLIDPVSGKVLAVTGWHVQ